MTHTNPAVHTYNIWRQLLTLRGSTNYRPRDENHHIITDTQQIRPFPGGPAITYGVSNKGIGIVGFDRFEQPLISFGYYFGNDGWLGQDLVLESTGRFRLGPHWGFQQRNRTAQATFLGTQHFRGKHYWYFDSQGREKRGDNYSYADREPRLDDYNTQIPYVSAGLLENTWNVWNWWELQRGEWGWEIVPSLNQALPGQEPRLLNSASGLAAWYNADKGRRERRYLRDENRRRRSVGEPVLSVPAARVEAEADTEVIQIMAALTINTPMTATPFNPRLREATDGDHMVTDDTTGS